MTGKAPAPRSSGRSSARRAMETRTQTVIDGGTRAQDGWNLADHFAQIIPNPEWEVLKLTATITQNVAGGGSRFMVDSWHAATECPEPGTIAMFGSSHRSRHVAPPPQGRVGSPNHAHSGPQADRLRPFLFSFSFCPEQLVDPDPAGGDSSPLLCYASQAAPCSLGRCSL